MKRSTQKTKKYGYRLRINPTNQPGKDNWRDVGHLFTCSDEADTYRQKHHSEAKKYSIVGVRLNVEPLAQRNQNNEAKS